MMAEGYAPISQRYGLVCNIPLHQDADGAFWTDPLWEKDLALHLNYCERFTLASPVSTKPVPDGFAKLDTQRITVWPLRANEGWPRTLANIPHTFSRLKAFAESHDIVHTDGAAWPFPSSFYFLPLRGKVPFFWVVVIESLPWLRQANSIKARVFNRLMGKVMARADARIYTHEGFRTHFGRPASEGVINPASWIDEASVISSADLAQRAARPIDQPCRVLLAGRLLEEKGVGLFLEAIRTYPRSAPPLEVTMIGAGAMEGACREAAADPDLPVRATFLDPVPYGAPFLKVIDEADLVVVPSITNEQPRLIYDAAARGVPVLASRTEGNQSILSDDTGFLFDWNDAAALRTRLQELANRGQDLRATGQRVWERLGQQTHAAMHRDRSHYLAQELKKARDSADPSSNAG